MKRFFKFLFGIQPKIGDRFVFNSPTDSWDAPQELVVTDVKPGFVRYRYLETRTQHFHSTRDFLTIFEEKKSHAR